MARPPQYTDAEDAILVATANMTAEETNERLREAGFTERTSNSLKQRRYYLRNRTGSNAAIREGVDQQLIELLVRRRSLTAELDKIRLREAAVLASLDDLNAQIRQVMESLDVDSDLVVS